MIQEDQHQDGRHHQGHLDGRADADAEDDAHPVMPRMLDRPPAAAFAARDQIHPYRRSALTTARMSAPFRCRHFGQGRLRVHGGSQPCSALAKLCGVRATLTLQPHKTRLFKLSNDPIFAEKLIDIVGLYIAPPEHAVVLSIDEKSQIQALDRTQPGLPMKKGRCGTMTHDYKRNGTTTLFAALNVLDGTVIGRCMQRHRHEEFIRFLNVTEAAVPKGKAIHAIVDNYATHKHPKVKEWLERVVGQFELPLSTHPDLETACKAAP